jgi:hypothetical protein
MDAPSLLYSEKISHETQYNRPFEKVGKTGVLASFTAEQM